MNKNPFLILPLLWFTANRQIIAKILFGYHLIISGNAFQSAFPASLTIGFCLHPALNPVPFGAVSRSRYLLYNLVDLVWAFGSAVRSVEASFSVGFIPA